MTSSSGLASQSCACESPVNLSGLHNSSFWRTAAPFYEEKPQPAAALPPSSESEMLLGAFVQSPWWPQQRVPAAVLLLLMSSLYILFSSVALTLESPSFPDFSESVTGSEGHEGVRHSFLLYKIIKNCCLYVFNRDRSQLWIWCDLNVLLWIFFFILKRSIQSPGIQH